MKTSCSLYTLSFSAHLVLSVPLPLVCPKAKSQALLKLEHPNIIGCHGFFLEQVCQ